jgi:hypothetical protein
VTTRLGSHADDSSDSRIITSQMNVKNIEKMRKEGHCDELPLYFDESVCLGGDKTAHRRFAIWRCPPLFD